MGNIYVVTRGEHSDYEIIKATISYHDAHNYVNVMNAKNPPSFEGDEHRVETFNDKNLDKRNEAKLKLYKVRYFCYGNQYEAFILEDDILSVSNHIVNTINEITSKDITSIEEISVKKGRLFDKEI